MNVTDDRQTDVRRHIAKVNVSARSLKIKGFGGRPGHQWSIPGCATAPQRCVTRIQRDISQCSKSEKKVKLRTTNDNFIQTVEITGRDRNAYKSKFNVIIPANIGTSLRHFSVIYNIVYNFKLIQFLPQ